MPDETLELYWGDLHSHCAISYGFGSLERAFKLAAQHLDFASVTGHATWHDMPTDRKRHGRIIDYHNEGFERLKNNWTLMQETVARYNHAEQFVSLLSYEWHSNQFGDHNIYCLDDTQDIIERDSLEALEKAFNNKEIMIIPHHIGYGAGYRGINWQTFDERRSPVVEVFSGHGSSMRDGGAYPMYHTMGPRSYKGTVAYGLSLGHKFGFVAGTDHHGGYPGHYGEGRTAVYAPSLTRQNIWTALRERRCYAVTGDRIEADFFINDAMMGEKITGDKRIIKVKARASDMIDRVEIIKNNRPLKRCFGNLAPAILKDPIHVKVRLEWGWGDKEELVSWQGSLRLSEGELTSVEPCFSGDPILAPEDDVEVADDDNPIHGIIGQDRRGLEWFSHSKGNPHPYLRATNALVLELKVPQLSTLDIQLNGQRFQHTLSELLEGSRSHFMRGWRSEALLIHRAAPKEQFMFSLEFEDEPEQDTDVYYVRIAQENNQWAWLSPIWVLR